MREIVFDCETDGLLQDCTKIHVLSYSYDGTNVTSTDDYKEMARVLTQHETLYIGHNVIMFDMPVFHKILVLEMNYQRYSDTLALSWFLEPNRQSHALGSFQKESGLVKPVVDDWENVTYDQMVHRCSSDVLLNWWLWQKQRKRLMEIYNG